MDNSTGSVLKAKDVKVQGSFHLDIGHPLRKAGNAVHASSVSPQVLIVESNADFAVLEITCPCGAKNRIRCEYADK